MWKKALLAAAALIALAVVVLMVAGSVLRSSGLPVRTGEHSLAGLEAEVLVRFDEWGVPHIQAERANDAVAALGWLHANDRMTQLELGRRAAFGRLSEILGEPTYEIDVYFRRLQLRPAAEKMLEQTSPASRAFLEAYSQGVNAWLDTRRSDLPPELRVLGVRPEPWQPLDSLGFVLMMANELSFWDQRPEEERFEWLRAFGPDALADLLGREVSFSQELLDIARPQPDQPPSAESSAQAVSVEPDASPGSNNWTIGKSRTASGQPLLAGDPHLALRLPGFWYQVLIRAPGYEVAGVSLPGTPGVTIGRGPNIAWSFTNVMLDDHDLVFEDVRDGRYRRRGEDGGDLWKDLVEQEETILLRGGEERRVVVRSTDLGPLLEADPERGLPPRSLLWTAHYGGDPIAALQEISRASTADEAVAAAGLFTVPAQNLVAALRDGTLLHTVLGRVPQRRSGDGRLPRLGWEEAVGWDGLRSSELDPRNVAPAEDVIVTANHDFLLDRPAESPYEHQLIANFDLPYRADRIRERLLYRDRRDWTVETFSNIQNDTVSRYASELIECLQSGDLSIDDYSGAASRTLSMLNAWNRDMSGTGGAALYALTQRELVRRVFDDDAEAHDLRPFGGRLILLRLFCGDTRRDWIDDVSTEKVETRKDIAEQALSAAWTQAAERWTANPNLWDYEELHQLTLEHALDAVPVFGDWARRGPYPTPGSGLTVAAFGARWTDDDTLDVVYGPSMRWVFDWSRPETLYFALPGGQSGHPGDVHYDDQMEIYLRGGLRASAWPEEEIARATIGELRLVPDAATP